MTTEPVLGPRICVFAQFQHEIGLGDLILRNALLSLVRQRYPAGEITLVVGADHAERFAGFLADHCLADAVLTCPPHPPGESQPVDDAADLAPGGDFLPCAEFDPSPFGESWPAFVDELRSQHFDVCVLDPGTTWLHAGTADAAGIPVRVGVVTGHPEDQFLTAAAPVSARADGAPDLADIDAACAVALGLPAPTSGSVRAPFPYRPTGPDLDLPHPRIAVHVGGGHAWNRRWPLANYVELANTILSTTDGSLILVGGTDEEADNAALIEQLGARWGARIWSTGAVSLARTATVLAACDMFTGSDSAPMHIAVAVGLPTVAVYGPCDGVDFWGTVLPDHTAVSHYWPCRDLPHSFWAREFAACEHHCRYAWEPGAPEYPQCIADIGADEVTRGVSRTLAGAAVRSTRERVPRPAARTGDE